METSQSINYCVKTYANDTTGQQYQCLPITTSGCCSSSTDQAKPESERQACTQTVSSGSIVCRSQADFESLCKDDESCPSDLVNGFQNAILVYTCTFLALSLVQGLRGYGLQQHAKMHYMDFWEQKSGWFEKLTLAAAKVGTSLEQYVILLFNIPAMIWLLYYSSYSISSQCNNAKDTDGEDWQLPSDAFAWYMGCIFWSAFLIFFSTCLRVSLPVRPELYNPQEEGNQDCTICGMRIDCRELRQEPCCDSSVFFGQAWYDRQRTTLKEALGTTCRRRCHVGKYLCWYPMWTLIYLSNVIFWATCGIFGALLQTFAAYKHWISV